MTVYARKYWFDPLAIRLEQAFWFLFFMSLLLPVFSVFVVAQLSVIWWILSFAEAMIALTNIVIASFLETRDRLTNGQLFLIYLQVVFCLLAWLS
jgi:hypothetical protein